MTDVYDIYDRHEQSHTTPLRFKCNNCKDTGWDMAMRAFGSCRENGCKEGERRRRESIQKAKKLRESIK